MTGELEAHLQGLSEQGVAVVLPLPTKPSAAFSVEAMVQVLSNGQATPDRQREGCLVQLHDALFESHRRLGQQDWLWFTWEEFCCDYVCGKEVPASDPPAFLVS